MVKTSQKPTEEGKVGIALTETANYPQTTSLSSTYSVASVIPALYPANLNAYNPQELEQFIIRHPAVSSLLESLAGTVSYVFGLDSPIWLDTVTDEFADDEAIIVDIGTDLGSSEQIDTALEKLSHVRQSIASLPECNAITLNVRDYSSLPSHE